LFRTTRFQSLTIPAPAVEATIAAAHTDKTVFTWLFLSLETHIHIHERTGPGGGTLGLTGL